MKQVRPIPSLPNDPDSRLHRKLDRIIELLNLLWVKVECQRIVADDMGKTPHKSGVAKTKKPKETD